MVALVDNSLMLIIREGERDEDKRGFFFFVWFFCVCIHSKEMYFSI